VPGAERDGEQEREFTQGGWSSSARDDDDEDDAMMTSGGVCVRRALSLGFPRSSATKTRASSVADHADETRGTGNSNSTRRRDDENDDDDGWETTEERVLRRCERVSLLVLDERVCA
jgi:hypothetical protein